MKSDTMLPSVRGTMRGIWECQGTAEGREEEGECGRMDIRKCLRAWSGSVTVLGFPAVLM